MVNQPRCFQLEFDWGTYWTGKRIHHAIPAPTAASLDTRECNAPFATLRKLAHSAIHSDRD